MRAPAAASAKSGSHGSGPQLAPGPPMIERTSGSRAPAGAARRRERRADRAGRAGDRDLLAGDAGERALPGRAVARQAPRRAALALEVQLDDARAGGAQRDDAPAAARVAVDVRLAAGDLRGLAVEREAPERRVPVDRERADARAACAVPGRAPSPAPTSQSMRSEPRARCRCRCRPGARSRGAPPAGRHDPERVLAAVRLSRLVDAEEGDVRTVGRPRAARCTSPPGVPARAALRRAAGTTWTAGAASRSARSRRSAQNAMRLPSGDHAKPSTDQSPRVSAARPRACARGLHVEVRVHGRGSRRRRDASRRA